MNIKIPVGVSNRHVHLTKETYQLLFNEEITKRNDLNQPGEFAANQTLTIKGPKGIIENVRIMGPFRNYNQVEIAQIDARNLGLNAPVRESGDLANSETITLITKKNTITLNSSCIIANRHIHMSEEQAKKFGLNNKDLVKVKIDGKKSAVVDALIKTSQNGFLEMHIDIDDANAFLLTSNSEVTMLL